MARLSLEIGLPSLLLTERQTLSLGQPKTEVSPDTSEGLLLGQLGFLELDVPSMLLYNWSACCRFIK